MILAILLFLTNYLLSRSDLWYDIDMRELQGFQVITTAYVINSEGLFILFSIGSREI